MCFTLNSTDFGKEWNVLPVRGKILVLNLELLPKSIKNVALQTRLLLWNSKSNIDLAVSFSSLKILKDRETETVKTYLWTWKQTKQRGDIEEYTFRKWKLYIQGHVYHVKTKWVSKIPSMCFFPDYFLSMLFSLINLACMPRLSEVHDWISCCRREKYDSPVMWLCCFKRFREIQTHVVHWCIRANVVSNSMNEIFYSRELWFWIIVIFYH